MSPESEDLIKKLIEPDPKLRLGKNGMEEITSHPFFKDFDWNNIRKMEAPLIPKKPNFSIISNDDNMPFSKKRKSKKLIYNRIGMVKFFY